MDNYGSSYDMPTDLMRYDLMTQDAMRSVVRRALDRARSDGLPGEHHFFITFVTHARGVNISPALTERYPQEMTIVLQHQFWGLEVTDHGFTVGLTFNKVPEKLIIPYSAVKGFFDPAVQFGLQFPVEDEKPVEEVTQEEAPATENGEDGEDATINWGDEEKKPAEEEAEEEEKGGVISLDSFRKK